MREWGVLLYVRSFGRGLGKLRGMFDAPTWLCMVPDGQWGHHLCVVDTGNYRYQLLDPRDGARASSRQPACLPASPLNH